MGTELDSTVEAAEEDSQSSWVLDTNWWYLPAITLAVVTVCTVVFALFPQGGPNAANLAAINAAFFATGYTLVVLLSPGFQLRHLMVGISLQFVAPLLLSQVEADYKEWIIAQWLVTASLLLVYQGIVLPKWRHERFVGSVGRRFSIRGLLLLTFLVAGGIAICRALGLASGFFWSVLLLCGPPLIGWIAALEMATLSPARAVILVGVAIVLMVGCLVCDSFALLRTFLEIEPLWMATAAASTLIVTNLLHWPYRGRRDD